MVGKGGFVGRGLGQGLARDPSADLRRAGAGQPLPDTIDNTYDPDDDGVFRFLQEHPEFIDRPATIVEFIGPDYLDLEATIRDAVLDALVDIFGEGVNVNRISEKRKAIFTGGIGIGKQNRKSEPVLTPTGWRTMGELRVGDKVIGKNGRGTEVLGVFPQVDIQMYRVRFKDGTWIDVGDEHLWEVHESKAVGVKQPDGSWRTRRELARRSVVSTQWLYQQKLQNESGGYRFRIPLVDPVEYDLPFEEVVDAYTLGLLLANGFFRNADASAPRRANPLAEALNKLGLHGVKARDRFIPSSYQFAPAKIRLELLRGLMDGDGSSGGRNSQTFSTSSRRLAIDVAALVRSLGGYCTVADFERRDAVEYRVHVNLGDVCPFRLPCKVSKWKPRTNQRPSRSIVSVTKLGREDGVCIKVAAPDSLYVTKDFIVTHNTTLASIAMLYMVHWTLCLRDPQDFFGLMPGRRIAFMLMSTTDAQAKEVLFGDIKANMHRSPWFKRNAPWDDKIKNQIRFPKDVWVLPGNSQDTRFEGYNVLCKDEKTCALTASGWKRYDELEVGEPILTLNHETGLAEWQPLQRINVFDSPGELVLMEGREFSSLSTDGHRWPTLSRAGRRRWRTTATLNGEDQIPIAAAGAASGTVKYSDALVEAVAWFYTEGSRVGGSSAVIYQKHGTRTCDRIRACLTELFGPPAEKFQTTSSASAGPMWRENINRSPDSHHGRPKGLSEFRLNRDAGAVLLAHAPDRVPSHEFLTNLTQSQLDMFIEVSLLADNRGERVFAQKRHEAAEAFAYAAILAGHSVSIRSQWQPVTRKGGTVDGYEMLLVRLMNKRVVRPVHAARNGRGAFTISRVPHDGIVWCPTVANGTWLARRNGSVYFTGNCGVIDEADSHKVTENKDYAQSGFETIENRIFSRFQDRGLIIVIGQMKSASGFAARTLKKFQKDPTASAIHLKQWESFGWERYRDPKTGKYEVFWFDIDRKTEVSAEMARDLRSEKIIPIPLEFKPAFDDNPVKALRDLAGIPPEAEDPFIAVYERVESAMQRWHDNHPPISLDGSEPEEMFQPVNKSCTEPRFHPLFTSDSPQKRVVHIDIAYSDAVTADALGFAMGHVEKIVDLGGEMKPYIVFDCLLRVKARTGQQIMLHEIRQLIYELRNDRGFRIAQVTVDGTNSVDMIQTLQRMRFSASYLSVDKTRTPYEDLREAIYERRIEFPAYVTQVKPGSPDEVVIAAQELRQLEDMGRKIDHPPSGSKDISDAMASVVYQLTGSPQYRRGARKVYADAAVTDSADVLNTYGPGYDPDFDRAMGPIDVEVVEADADLGAFLGGGGSSSGLPSATRLPSLQEDPFGSAHRRGRLI